jgi:putative MATE family efflux protein
MVSQNILNLVDAAMVGSLGDAALAATGMGSFVNWLCFSAILGLASAVQAMAARRLGEGHTSEVAKPLNGGLLIALAIGLPLSLMLLGAAEPILALLLDDPQVLALAIPYLQIRLLGMAGVGMNFAFRGFWSAVEQTRFYLITLLVMHSLNILLNWILIYGNLGMPAMGVQGAALGSTLAIYGGTLLHLGFASARARQWGFMHGLPSLQRVRTLLGIALPASAQNLFFSGGMVALFWIIGQIGTAELAAAHVLMTLVLAGLLPSMAFGLAGASLVGQSLGRGEPRDAWLWAWQVTQLATWVAISIGTVVFLFHRPILGVFLDDPGTLSLAIAPLMLAAGGMIFDATGTVLMNAHHGAGDTRRIMLASMCLQWGLFLPAAWWVGPQAGGGLLAVWLCWAAYRLLHTLTMVTLWQRGAWAQARA